MVMFPSTVLTPVMLKRSMPSSGVKTTSNRLALKLLFFWHWARDCESSLRSAEAKEVSASSADINVVKAKRMVGVWRVVVVVVVVGSDNGEVLLLM